MNPKIKGKMICLVVSCIVGALLRKRLTQAGVLKLQNAVSE